MKHKHYIRKRIFSADINIFEIKCVMDLSREYSHMD